MSCNAVSGSLPEGTINFGLVFRRHVSFLRCLVRPFLAPHTTPPPLNMQSIPVSFATSNSSLRSTRPKRAARATMIFQQRRKAAIMSSARCSPKCSLTAAVPAYKRPCSSSTIHPCVSAVRTFLHLRLFSIYVSYFLTTSRLMRTC